MLTNSNVYCGLDKFAKEYTHRNYKALCGYLESMYETFVGRYDETVVRATPGFTGHGIKHTNRILSFYDQLLSKFMLNLEAASKIGGNDLCILDQGCDELFILIAATVWHDVGMKFGRENHAKQVRENPDIFDTIGGLLGRFDKILRNKIVELIGCIAAAHSDYESLQECAPKTSISGFAGRDLTVRANALAGILRLCDELSDDRSRVDWEYIDKIEDKSKIYWLHSSCVEYSKINLDNECVEISYEIPFEELKVKHQVTVLKKTKSGRIILTKKKVDLLNFILNRIDKVHAEMSMCCPLFSDFAHINELKVKLTFTCVGKKNKQYSEISMINETTRTDRSDYYDDISKYKVCEAAKFTINLNEIESYFA